MHDSRQPTLDELARAVQCAAVVHVEASQAPTLQEEAPIETTEDLRKDAAEYSLRLGYDEDIAVFRGKSASLTELPEDGGQLRYGRLRFSAAMAFRARGELPRFIAASAIPVDYERRELVLHQRSSSVKTYPGMVHTVGGAFVPGEDDNLMQSLQRESEEEAGIILEPEPVTREASVLIGEELSTGSVQIVYLHRGFRRLKKVPRPNDQFGEGTPLFVPFDELPELLREDGWVPSGRLHILAWLRQLAYHSACAGIDAHFGQWSAAELLAETLEQAWKAPDNAVIIG